MPVGDVDVLFRAMRAKLAEQVLRDRKTLPTQAAIDAGLAIDCGPILDALRVRNDCCRKTLVTAMEFQEYY
jgi:hypothetical protein